MSHGIDSLIFEVKRFPAVKKEDDIVVKGHGGKVVTVQRRIVAPGYVREYYLGVMDGIGYDRPEVYSKDEIEAL